MNTKKNGEDVNEMTITHTHNKNEDDNNLLGKIHQRKDIVGLDVKSKKHKNKKKKTNKTKANATSTNNNNTKTEEDEIEECKGNDTNEQQQQHTIINNTTTPIINNNNDNDNIQEDTKTNDIQSPNEHIQSTDTQQEVHSQPAPMVIQDEHTCDNKLNNAEEEDEESFSEDFLKEEEPENPKQTPPPTTETPVHSSLPINDNQTSTHNSNEYNTLLDKYTALEQKYNTTLKEKTFLEHSFLKHLQQQPLTNTIPTSTENISDLLDLANAELDEKNTQIATLTKQLEMHDLSNIKNFSLTKLTTFKEYYLTNLKQIEAAISSFQ